MILEFILMLIEIMLFILIIATVFSSLLFKITRKRVFYTMQNKREKVISHTLLIAIFLFTVYATSFIQLFVQRAVLSFIALILIAVLSFRLYKLLISDENYYE